MEPKVKEENLPRNDNGEIVYSKFDFLIKEDKKRRVGFVSFESLDRFCSCL